MTAKEVADWFKTYASFGYPLQAGYASDLLIKILEIRASGGPKPDEVREHLELDDMRDDRRNNVRQAMDVWDNWQVLLDTGLREGLIKVNPRPTRKQD